jgi:hypothetical protein
MLERTGPVAVPNLRPKEPMNELTILAGRSRCEAERFTAPRGHFWPYLIAVCSRLNLSLGQLSKCRRGCESNQALNFPSKDDRRRKDLGSCP